LEKNLVKNKKQIRKEILNIRNSMNTETIRTKSLCICNRLIDSDLYKDADTVLLYSSFGSEVMTSQLTDHAIDAGKYVYLPRVCGDTMDFFIIKDRNNLVEGSWGIREPLPISENKFKGDAKALVIMPLVAFDRNGNRIGYGKGFYDKFLDTHSTGVKVGIAFSEQESVIDAQPCDIRMDYIITDKGIIKSV